MAKIISVVNQKGGTGKSACAANLAVGLSHLGQKVLIVDADPQSDVSASLGYRDCDSSNETLSALMEMVLEDTDIPEDCYIRHQRDGVDIICSNIGLAGTEVQLVNTMSREFILKQIINTVKDRYDTILIDCMPSLGMITINALAASDEVLIPVEKKAPEKSNEPVLAGNEKPAVQMAVANGRFCGAKWPRSGASGH